MSGWPIGRVETVHGKICAVDLKSLMSSSGLLIVTAMFVNGSSGFTYTSGHHHHNGYFL